MTSLSRMLISVFVIVMVVVILVQVMVVQAHPILIWICEYILNDLMAVTDINHLNFALTKPGR